jgi:hypothetical protein
MAEAADRQVYVEPLASLPPTPTLGRSTTWVMLRQGPPEWQGCAEAQALEILSHRLVPLCCRWRRDEDNRLMKGCYSHGFVTTGKLSTTIAEAILADKNLGFDKQVRCSSEVPFDSGACWVQLTASSVPGLPT